MVDHKHLAQQEMARRQMARRHIIPFATRFYPEYMAGWAHKVIAAKLEQFLRRVVAKESPRLMIFMPPQTGKSMLVSDIFPSWGIGQYPSLRFILTSYSISLPIRFSRYVRERLKMAQYQKVFPDVSIHPEVQSAEHWETMDRGGFKAVGVGGSITGHGAEVIIVDDPFKDYQEAYSETIRETVHDWYPTTLRTRLQPGGGIININCLAGDTLVLLGDGTEKPIRDIRPGDVVATRDRGILATSTVLNWKNQGYDPVFRITTSSGKIVRANARHPFLVEHGGVCQWTRVRDLKLGQRIVTLKASGGSGKGKFAQPKAVKNQQNVEGFVCPTTISGGGLLATAHRLATKIRDRALMLSSSTAMALHSTNTKPSWPAKAGNVQYAAYPLPKQETLNIGPISFASTIATIAMKFAASCVIDATSRLAEAIHQRFLKSRQPTFEGDEIVAIEPGGVEEVFDIEVKHTENFVANGLVSHNTRWHDDDLSGWLLRQDKDNLEAGVPDSRLENWEVLSLPALAECDEYVDREFNIHYEPAPGRVKVRSEGEALHPERHTEGEWETRKAGSTSQQWSALYQQNPVPDSGEYFTRDDFVFYDSPPVMHDYPVLFAWDLAVGEKKTNDWTVGLAGVVIPQDGINTLWILDMFRRRVRDKELYEAVVNMYLKYKRNASRIGMEYGQLFLSVERPILTEFRKKGITPVWDRDLRPVSDKRVRATPARGWMQHHRVKWPKNVNWVDTAMSELLRFDAGVNDDIVDALAWLVRMAEKMAVVQKKTPRRGFKTVDEQIRDYYRQQQAGSGSGFMSA